MPTFNAAPPTDVLRSAIADGAFPGCSACVGNAAGPLWSAAFGRLAEKGGQPATEDTVYDLASLTKIVATTAVTMALASEGRLSPEDSIGAHIDAFQSEPKRELQLRDLMAHASGLPAWKPFYREHANREAILAAAASVPLERPPRKKTVYSDIGAILWGEWLARRARIPLATLAWRTVFSPLAMRDTLFRPPRSWRDRIAPTELDTTYRNHLVHGEVHDENAHAMGGVSGHAGLFSTARDVGRMAEELLRSRSGDGTIFSSDVTKEFTRRVGLVDDSSRALGWDTPSGKSSAGELFSRHAVGHTGFTGTSIWIDLDREIYAILLTNRVHPTRRNRKIFAVRRKFHDAVIRALS